MVGLRQVEKVRQAGRQGKARQGREYRVGEAGGRR